MTLHKTHVIETKRCRLRMVSKEDIPHVFSATRHDGFNDGMPWEPPATLTALEQPLEKNIAQWEQGTAFNFTIEEQETGRFIGRIGVRPEEEQNVWSVGFWTHPERQGEGFMTEALPALIELAFSRLGADRVEACHAVWNKASRRVMENAGMSFVRHVPHGFQKNGEWVKEDMLAVDKSTWKQPPNQNLERTRNTAPLK